VRTILGLSILMILCLAMAAGQGQKTAKPASAADLVKKANDLFDDSKWTDAKQVYVQLLKDFADDPAVSGSTVTIQERIMRCDFYKDEFDLKKVLADEFGLKNVTIQEGKNPSIDVTFDFSDEKQAKFFNGGEIAGGMLQNKAGGYFRLTPFQLADPCTMEFKVNSIGGYGMVIAMFVGQNYKGDNQGYYIVFGQGMYEMAGALSLEGKTLFEQRAKNLMLKPGDTVKISKINNKFALDADKLKFQHADKALSKGYIYIGPLQAGSSLRIDDVKVKSNLDPAGWASLKGELENMKWIPFKQEYAKKYGAFADGAKKTEGVPTETVAKTDEEKKKEEEAKQKEMQERARRFNPTAIMTDGIQGKETGYTEDDLKLLANIIDQFNKQKFNDADKDLTALIEKKPEAYLWLYMRGIVRMNNSNTEGAIADLVKARTLAPSMPLIPFALGFAYAEQEEYMKGIECFRAVTAIDPKFMQAYLYECLMIFRNDDIVGAQARIEEVAKQFPDDELMKIARKMFYLMKNGPEWIATYTAEGPHYIIYSERSQEEANKVKINIEAVYNFYSKFFPYQRKDKKKYPVYVFNSFGSFADYAIDSGEVPPHPGLLGLYAPMLDHLLIRGDISEYQMFNTLYHEGLHQYLDYYIKDAPIWFNEGLATFFECSYFEGGNFKAGVINKGRLEGLLAGLDGKVPGASIRPLKDFMLSDAAEFMGNIGNQAILNYSQAWSMIYFLLMNPEMMEKYLKPYFKLLKDGNSKEEAFQATFAPVIQTIELKWKDYYQNKKYEDKK
jgi:hypothetical protein